MRSATVIWDVPSCFGTNNYCPPNYDGKFHGHSGADNMDIRYADRSIDSNHDWIWGVSANNNPSIADVWNTAPAWMQYVPVPSPTSSRFIDGTTPYPGLAAGGNLAGITAYVYWNQMLYVEVGGQSEDVVVERSAQAFVPAYQDDGAFLDLPHLQQRMAEVSHASRCFALDTVEHPHKRTSGKRGKLGFAHL